ncbi:autoinducer 2 ABC transporter substrate-binding protein [Enterocloster aldensis]|nr:autoinducer 2 ABC transporter substrate-binding protein [Clostridium sp.]NSJ49441.1 autoinducer 2 ABC transporter substrate-binding protein [Enterocloster aldenensis]RGC28153.1 autoinducer 2 ABC transporter substrate-binding protein [Enterocloster aldenensis]RGC61284.1 autoinducer 2 ABC transporter substrate-binding protein [Dorea longicatena]
MMAGIFISSCYGTQLHDKGTYAIVMKSRDNWYNELASQGYRSVIEDAGKNCLTLYPEEATAQEQVRLIRNLIHEQVDAIAVAANDVDALAPALREAREKGISVITLDADAQADSRSIYIKPVDAEKLGRALVRSACELCGGSGQWCILSAGSRSANQNEWMYWMKKELEEAKYKDMRLVDIAFGEGVYDKAAKETERLLKNYPDVKVICSLSTEGIKAAADVVKKQGKEKTVKVIGLGLPSQMAEYIGDGEEDICPMMYIWDPVEMGKVAALVSMGLWSGDIEEQPGEDILLDNGRTYRIDTGYDGGLEIISGEPIRIDKDNIEYWETRL